MKRILLICITSMLTVLAFGKTEIIRNNNSITVNISIEDLKIEEEDNFTAVSYKGCNRPATPGSPDLPFSNFKIALPPKGKINFQILNRNSREVSISKNIRPVPYIEEGEKTEKLNYQIDSEKYFSKPVIEKTNNGISRFINFQNLNFNPISYNKKTKSLSVTSDISFKISILGDTNYRTEINDPLSDLITKSFINREQAKNWRFNPKTPVVYADFSTSTHWYKIEVDKKGFFKINYNDLNNSNFPIEDADPENFRIFTADGSLLELNSYERGNQFVEIPIIVNGENDNSFDSDDSIIFYGNHRDFEKLNEFNSKADLNPYGKEKYYWLTFNSDLETEPKRISYQSYSNPVVTADHHSRKIHIEYEKVKADPHNLRWYEILSTGSSNLTKSISFTANNPLNADNDTLSYGYRADESNEREISISINGDEFSSTSSSTVAHISKKISISNITDGQNNLFFMFDKQNRVNNLYFDYVKIQFEEYLKKTDSAYYFNMITDNKNTVVQYQLQNSLADYSIFELSNPLAGTSINRLEKYDDNSFLGSSSHEDTEYYILDENDYLSVNNIEYTEIDNIADEMNQIDLILITPEKFVNQTEQIVDLYPNKNCKIVKLQDIFNQFNGGMPDPGAIRLYLKYATYNYTAPAPTHVLLIGSGTSDWRNNSGFASSKNNIPAYVKTSYASDDFFTYFENFSYPEIAIGRISAQNDDELETYLERLTKRIEDPKPGIWQNELFIIADDYFHSGSNSDVTHTIQAQHTKDYIAENIFVKNLLARDYEMDPYANKPAVRDQIIEELNEGKMLWYYIGHGSPDLLGDEDYFRNTNIQQLNNLSKLPLFIAASCSVGYFDNYNLTSMAEKMIVAPNGGSIASIAASTGCNGPTNTRLMYEFAKECFNHSNDLGTSLMLAKNSYTSTTNSEKFIIFGDPLLKINTPTPLENISIEGDPDSLKIGKKYDFSGSYSDENVNGINEIYINDSQTDIAPVVSGADSVMIKTNRNMIFKGQSSVESGNFTGNFIIPENIVKGEGGRIVSYIFDENTKNSYCSFIDALKMEGQEDTENTDVPEISLYLNNYNFKNNDTVHNYPKLIADISDDNGINLTKMDGKSILAVIDNDLILDITDSFIYDLNSSTQGKANYILPSLEFGEHSLQVIAFDNIGKFNTSTINFSISENSDNGITRALPYPNPFEKDCHFTFKIMESGDVSISIYTITGRKIRTIEKMNCSEGNNKIYWDGKDADGDEIANNTYFYKIKLKSPFYKNDKEKIGKIIKLK